jgi:hypothetical protein
MRTVEVYPMSGEWDAPWIKDDPDGDAFAKVSRGICDAYSATLADIGQGHSVSSLRIFVDVDGQVVPTPPDPRQMVVLSPSHTDPVTEGFEQATVRVPLGFAALALDEQRRIVLDAVHAAARGMAQFRGLELAAFEQARTAVLETGSVFTWTGDWKSSPGQRWRARCCFRTMADGFGRLTLEVSSPDGSVSARSSEQIAWTTVEGYQRAAKTLRWNGPDRVEVVPCVGLFGYNTGILAVEVESQSPEALRLREVQKPGLPSAFQDRSHAPTDQPEVLPEDCRHAPVEGPLPQVALVVPDTTTREIRAVGGGPANYVPDQYWKTLHALFEQLRGSDWQEWWAAADLSKLEVWWRAEYDGPERLFVRRSKNKVIARIERTSVGLRDADPAQAARDDLTGLMTAVQHRMGLGTPPALI